MENKKIYILIGVGVLVCIIVVVVVYFMTKDKSKTKKLEAVSPQTPPSESKAPTEDAWQLRYLKVSRTISGYIDVASIEAWYNTTRIYAVYVTGSTVYEGFWHTNANDDDYDSFAMVRDSKDAFIELDFGKDIRANKIRIVHHNADDGRDINIVLTAMDEKEREVFQVINTRSCKEMSLLYPSTSILRRNTISDWK